MSKVTKNGEVVAEFLYDADGMRIKAIEKLEEKQTNRTTYYVYGYSGKVLMEESSDTSSPDVSYSSYIYAFNKTFAKVDGIVGVSTEISYFHYDNVGSTRLMTDSTGKILMDQDYMPFGGDLPKVGQVEVYNEIGMEYKFTGQNEVVSVGLYYYGARYYDPAIGRFITEDTYPGEMGNPQSQNLYVYVVNNPLRYVDPTGNIHAEFADSTISYSDDETESSEDKRNSGNESGKKNKSGSKNNTDIEVPDIDIEVLDHTEKEIKTNIPGVTHKQITYYDTENKREVVVDIYTNKVGNEVRVTTVFTTDKKTVFDKNEMEFQWYSVSGVRDEMILYDENLGTKQRNLLAVEGFVTGAKTYRAIMIGVSKEGVIGDWQGNTLPNDSTKYATIAPSMMGEPYVMSKVLHHSSVEDYKAIALNYSWAISTTVPNPNEKSNYTEEFLKTVPDKYLVTAYTLAGLSLEERGDIEKARELYRLAIEQQDSDNIEILLAQNRLGMLTLETIYKPVSDDIYFVRLTFVNKIKSSSAKLEGKRLYSIRNIIDETPKTAWVEGKDDEGIGEWIEFSFGDKLNSLYNFNSKGREINSINIINGYAKSENLYHGNNRVKKIKISFDDGTSIVAELEDGKLQPQKITLPETKKVKKVKITILDVYKSSKYNDTCISEISFD